MMPAELMDKAIRAIASAKLLLDAGDVDGACNRAYYAMFDAARAALLLSGAPVDPVVAKSHSGLITAFSLHLVQLSSGATCRAGRIRAYSLANLF